MAEQIMRFKDCPICKKNLISDATAMGYCKLCGMALPTNTMIIKTESQEMIAFCCKDCEIKYSNVMRIKQGKKKCIVIKNKSIPLLRK